MGNVFFRDLYGDLGPAKLPIEDEAPEIKAAPADPDEEIEPPDEDVKSHYVKPFNWRNGRHAKNGSTEDDYGEESFA